MKLSCVPPTSQSQPASRPPIGAKPGEGPEIEADDAAAQVVGRAELQDRVRVRRPEREAGPRDEEQDAHAQTVASGASASSETLKPPVPRTSTFQLARPSAGGQQRPDERAAAEARGEDPEHLRPGCQRVRGEQRQDHVEVEADRADDGDDQEHEPHLRADASTQAKPSRMPRIIVGGSPLRSSGTSSSFRIISSPASTARKVTALSSEADADAERGDQDAGDRGADDA